jgi:hypothetical protein
MRDEPRAQRATFDWRQGYIKVKDLATGEKKYHGILWRGANMQASKKGFATATEASEYGHEARKKTRLLRRLFEKEENDDLHESDNN